MNPELLTNMSLEELNALAEARLAPAAQAELDELLARNADQPLSDAEASRVDYLLRQADQLTLLKTRARFTLSQLAAEPAAP